MNFPRSKFYNLTKVMTVDGTPCVICRLSTDTVIEKFSTERDAQTAINFAAKILTLMLSELLSLISTTKENLISDSFERKFQH